MKKFFFIVAICFISSLGIKAQSIEQSCILIETEVKGGIYSNFDIGGKGFLSYMYRDDKGSETIINIDITQITVSKDNSTTGYKVWIKCNGGTNCITEKGRIGNDENYNASYSKTYIPAKDERGMLIIYNQLMYILKLGNSYR